MEVAIIIRGHEITLDDSVKSPEMSFPVIPAEAGIQCFQGLQEPLDPGFHRGENMKARTPNRQVVLTVSHPEKGAAHERVYRI
jgi:hypothetical protein